MNNPLHWSSDIARLKAELNWLSTAFAAQKETQLCSSEVYRAVAAIDSGRVFSRRFYEAIQCLGKQGCVGPVLLVVRSPDPIALYWDNFGIIPLVDIPMSTSAESFLEILHLEPCDAADSIASQAEEFVFCDNSRQWIVLVERNGELARLFVKVGVDGDRYEKCLPPEWCFEAHDVAEHLQRFDLSPNEIDGVVKAISGKA